MLTRLTLSLLALTGLALVTTSAQAQGRRLDLERFRPAPDRDGFLTMPGTRTPGPWNYDIGLYSGYASEQLVLRDPIDDSTTAVISDRVLGDFYFQLGIAGVLAVVVDAPFIVYQRGDAAALDGGGALQSGAIRDPRIAARLRLIGEDASVERDRHEGEGLALQAAMTVPIGHEGAFAGEGGPQLEVDVIADFHILGIGIGGLLGYRHRFAEPTVLGISFRNQAYLTLGVQVPTFFLEDLTVLAEFDLATDLENPFQQTATTTSEWRGGLRYLIGDVALTAMAGTGLVGGVGSPGFRGMFGATFSPRVHDRDHDGIPDASDECASLPEDFDGHEDENGCPEPDNDHDLVPDLDDACPDDAAEAGMDEDDDGCTDVVRDADGDNLMDDGDGCPQAPEDVDGFEDEDGCPDLDHDSDGVPTPADQCEGEGEDRDGFQDEDGCPDPDDDGDGIVDGGDACPREAEDADAFEPNDGCPEPDDDRDGVPDATDTCPTQAETINGRRDDDGCPDPGTGAWRVIAAAGTDAFAIEGRVTIGSDGAIAASSANAIDQLARHLSADWRARHQIEVTGLEGEPLAALAAQLTARGLDVVVVTGTVGPRGRVRASRAVAAASDPIEVSLPDGARTRVVAPPVVRPPVLTP
jgi:hypothetical protein